jgi:ParB family chromosome partitioning protein
LKKRKIMAQKGKRKALGRGLGALIPIDREQASIRSDYQAQIFQCPVEKLTPNAGQPRQSFSERKLRELTDSVKAKGVIHPLIVRVKDGGYQIITGERRWRAAKLAGLKSVPVIVKDMTESDMLELALIENLQREDLNPLEEADAYMQLIEEHGLKQEELAKRVGRQRSSVANVLRLLKLPDEVRRYLMTGQLSMGHARAILGAAGDRVQVQLARQVVKEGMSVRECEELVRRRPRAGGKSKRSPRKHRYSPQMYQLVESMQRSLGTKVDIHPGKKGGRVVIHYYSPEELDRIVEVVRRK